MPTSARIVRTVLIVATRPRLPANGLRLRLQIRRGATAGPVSLWTAPVVVAAGVAVAAVAVVAAVRHSRFSREEMRRLMPVPLALLTARQITTALAPATQQAKPTSGRSLAMKRTRGWRKPQATKLTAT